jgi:hypothetical protein
LSGMAIELDPSGQGVLEQDMEALTQRVQSLGLTLAIGRRHYWKMALFGPP